MISPLEISHLGKNRFERCVLLPYSLPPPLVFTIICCFCSLVAVFAFVFFVNTDFLQGIVEQATASDAGLASTGGSGGGGAGGGGVGGTAFSVESSDRQDRCRCCVVLFSCSFLLLLFSLSLSRSF